MFTPVTEDRDIEAVATLAGEIWHQHFTPLIGIEQVSYMLDRFQSFEAVKKQIENSEYHYFLIEDEGDAVGYFAYVVEESFLFLSKLYLTKGARGKGLAKKVFAFLEEEAAHNQVPAIQLNVFKGNSHVIEIYEAMGFETIDAPQIDIGQGFILDDYVMRKRLDV